MTNGFVAFLDILGFSSLVLSEQTGNRLQGYLAALQASVDAKDKTTPVNYVVFSDSIILTVEDDTIEGLKKIARSCSRLFANVLEHDIPLRGAISRGSFVYQELAKGGVFIAGRAVVEAYSFESKQDWVGIMLAPSALSGVPDLYERCRLLNSGDDAEIQRVGKNIDLSAFIQHWPTIPFHPDHPLETALYSGFAIVPTSGIPIPGIVRSSVESAVQKLSWLQSIAPDPHSQNKYRRSIEWLGQVFMKWQTVTNYVDAAERLKREAAERQKRV
jgi:hypothetical protein